MKAILIYRWNNFMYIKKSEISTKIKVNEFNNIDYMNNIVKSSCTSKLYQSTNQK